MPDPRPAELGGGWRLRLLENGEEVGGGVSRCRPTCRPSWPPTRRPSARWPRRRPTRMPCRGVRVARHPARRRGTGLSGRRRPVRRSADPHHPAQVLNTLRRCLQTSALAAGGSGQSWRAAPFVLPLSHRLLALQGRQGRVLALRAAGRTNPLTALPGHSRGSTARFQGTPRGGVGVKGRRGCWRGPQPAGRGHGQPRRGRSPALDAYGTPIASAGEQEKGEARPLLPRRMGQDPMRGSSPKGAGQARRARRGDSSPPLGASICGRGSRREAVGNPAGVPRAPVRSATALIHSAALPRRGFLIVFLCL